MPLDHATPIVPDARSQPMRPLQAVPIPEAVPELAGFLRRSPGSSAPARS